MRSKARSFFPVLLQAGAGDPAGGSAAADSGRPTKAAVQVPEYQPTKTGRQSRPLGRSGRQAAPRLEACCSHHDEASRQQPLGAWALPGAFSWILENTAPAQPSRCGSHSWPAEPRPHMVGAWLLLFLSGWNGGRRPGSSGPDGPQPLLFLVARPPQPPTA